MRELHLNVPLSVADALDILGSAPQVIKAKFLNISSSGPTVRNTEDRQVLRLLSHLTLAGKARLSHLLNKVAGPSLQSLSLQVKEGPTFDDTESFYHLRDFLASCSVSLSSLDLSELCLQEANLITLLGLLPSIQELSIYETRNNTPPAISDLFIRALTEVGITPLCPRLVWTPPTVDWVKC